MAPDHDKIRHWKVDRIEDAHLEDFSFQRPKDFDLTNHLSKSFGVFHGDGEVHVRIHFASTVARYVQESAWHPSQEITAQEDGSLLAEFDLDGAEEIKRWVMSFGRHAEVLGPEELREEMREELAQTLGRYGEPAKPKAHREGAAK